MRWTCSSTWADDSKVMPDDVTTGTSLVTSAGKSHSCERPTSRCAPPMSASTSVADGCRETTRGAHARPMFTSPAEGTRRALFPDPASAACSVFPSLALRISARVGVTVPGPPGRDAYGGGVVKHPLMAGRSGAPGLALALLALFTLLCAQCAGGATARASASAAWVARGVAVGPPPGAGGPRRGARRGEGRS